jgi:hypothetical protein
MISYMRVVVTRFELPLGRGEFDARVHRFAPVATKTSKDTAEAKARTSSSELFVKSLLFLGQHPWHCEEDK